MAKVRFRDLKQGKTPNLEELKKRKKSNESRYITTRERMKAFVTDSFMILMPIMYAVIYLVMGSREGFAQRKLLGWLYILIPYVAITATFIAKSGQTPGMRAYNMRVVDIRSKNKPSMGQAYLRQILGLVDFFLFTWLVGVFRKDNRTLHEILSRTTLVYAPEKKKDK